jgi:transketolase
MALEPLVAKWQSFGWQVTEVDGHDISALIPALRAAQSVTGKPSILIAHTIKGKGVSFVEADFTFHGRALKPDQAIRAREEILCQ